MVKFVLKNRGMPTSLSDVEFNRVIKLICKDVGIDNLVHGNRRNPVTNRKETGLFEKWKLISSHTCRRSFATNLYKSGLSTLVIMQITGHSTERNFLKYIKVTPKGYAEQLADHWKCQYIND
jgi:integrase